MVAQGHRGETQGRRPTRRGFDDAAQGLLGADLVGSFAAIAAETYAENNDPMPTVEFTSASTVVFTFQGTLGEVTRFGNCQVAYGVLDAEGIDITIVDDSGSFDCTAEVAANPDFILSVAVLEAWEAKHGAIKAGEWVVLRSDWDKRSHDENLFLNANETGPHTPGPTAEVIEYLIGKGIVGWGSQCIGTDAGQAGGMTPPFPAHNLLHKHNCYGLASLANLSKLPAKGAILIAAPLKIKQGTGSPIRALALVPKG